MTPYTLYERLTQLRLTTCPWPDFTSTTARAAIGEYGPLILGKHQGKVINLEQAFQVVYGEPLVAKKGRKRA